MEAYIRFYRNRIETVETIPAGLDVLRKEVTRDVKKLSMCKKNEQVLIAELKKVGFVALKSKAGQKLKREKSRRLKAQRQQQAIETFQRKLRVKGFVILSHGKIVVLNGVPMVARYEATLKRRISEAFNMRHHNWIDEFSENGYSVRTLQIVPFYANL